MKRHETIEYCKNCNCKVDVPSHQFCPYCGQRYLDKITLRSLFYNAINGFFSFDSKLIKTFTPFLLKPGSISEKFVQGKRQTYLHPVQTYVFFSFIFLLSLSQISKKWDKALEHAAINNDVLKFNFDSDNEEIAEEETEIIDSLVQEGLIDSTLIQIDSLGNLQLRADSSSNKQLIDSMIAINATNDEIIDKLFEVNRPNATGKLSWYTRLVSRGGLNIYRRNAEKLVSSAVSQLSLVLVVFVPIYALLLWFFFMRKKKTFAEHLTHALYLFSYVFLFATLLLWLGRIDGLQVPALLSFLIVPPIYFFFSFKRFYKSGWFKSAFNLVAISFIFGILFIGVGSMLTVLLTFINYN